MLDITELRNRRVDVNPNDGSMRGPGTIRGGYVGQRYGVEVLLFLVEFQNGDLGEYTNNQIFLR